MKKRQIVGRLVVIMVVGVGLIVVAPTPGAKAVNVSVRSHKVLSKDRVTIEGVVKLLHKDKSRITVKTDEGKTYLAILGAKQSDLVKVGDRIKIEGVQSKTGKIVVWKLTKADGTVVTLRTESGKLKGLGSNTPDKGRKGFRTGMREGYKVS